MDLLFFGCHNQCFEAPKVGDSTPTSERLVSLLPFLSPNLSQMQAVRLRHAGSLCAPHSMCISRVNLFSPDEIIFEAKELEEGKETFPLSHNGKWVPLKSRIILLIFLNAMKRAIREQGALQPRGLTL